MTEKITKWELFNIMEQLMYHLLSVISVYNCKKEDMKRIRGMFAKYIPLPEEYEEPVPEEIVIQIKRRIGEPLFNMIYDDVRKKYHELE